MLSPKACRETRFASARKRPSGARSAPQGYKRYGPPHKAKKASHITTTHKGGK